MTVRLEALAPRFGTRDETGSALTWDAADKRVSYLASATSRSTSWSAHTGPGHGEVARVVRVRGDLAYRMSGAAVVSMTIDHYAFQSTEGRLVGTGIPSGVSAGGGMRPCYPPEEVRRFAEQMGVPYVERSVTDWPDLRRRFDTLVPDTSTYARLAATGAWMYGAFGVIFTLLAIGGVALAATVSVTGGIFVTVLSSAGAAALVNGALHMSPRFLRGRVSRSRTD